jgi:cyclase
VFARHYYEQGADELLYMDIVASLYERNNLLDIVERTARDIFIPLCVGGGLRTLDDIRQVLRAGADKVSINTAAVRRPAFVHEAVMRFGASTIVVSVEAIQKGDGAWEAYTDNGREKTGLDAVAWSVRCAEMGCGELLVTSIDREGTGKGYDLELTRRIAESVPVPVIACGGAGRIQHVEAVLGEGRAEAACVASLLHYGFVRHHAPTGEYDPEINLAHLKTRRGFGKIEDAGLADLKRALEERGIHSRPLPTTANG